MLTYYLVYPIALLIGLLPYKAQFLLADVIRFLLHKVFRYRVKVVRTNLANAFPEKSEAQRRLIEKQFYNHLSDVFLETISLATVNREQIARRMEYTNIDQVENETQGKSWIGALAHYGSWEYTINFALNTRHDEVLAVYRPLADRGMDHYYIKARSRFGVTPVPMSHISRELIARKQQGKHVVVALIADQTPPRSDDKEWMIFLNQGTQFFMGMEKMALKLRMPVYFMSLDKVKRGYYRATFEQIYDGEEKVEPYEITRRYARRLEEMIRRRPELWMWSHRRWKHLPPYHPQRIKEGW